MSTKIKGKYLDVTTAGAGLVHDGQELDVGASDTTIIVDPDGIKVNPAVIATKAYADAGDAAQAAATALKADTTTVNADNAAQDAAIALKASTASVNAANAAQDAQIAAKADAASTTAALATKAATTYVDAQNAAQDAAIALKAATTYVDSQDAALAASKASTTYVDAQNAAQDAASAAALALKASIAYVDTQVSQVAAGFDPKASCRLLSSSPITLSGLQTIDGVMTFAGDRIAVAGQGGDLNTEHAANGIYVAAAGAWSRSTDADGNPNNEVTDGMCTSVTEGTLKGQYYITSSVSGDPIIVDTDVMKWNKSGSDITAADLALKADTSYVNSQDALSLKKDGSNSMTADLNLNNHKVVNVNDPTVWSDASNKNYVDNSASSVLGAVAVNYAPISYVDSRDAQRVAKSGDSMTGILNMTGSRIAGLGTPSASDDAVTKAYVDSADALKQNKRNANIISTSTTLSSAHDFVYVDTTSVTITLPTASSLPGKVYSFTSSPGFTLTAPPGGFYNSGFGVPGNSLSVSAGDSLVVESNGASWFITNNNDTRSGTYTPSLSSVTGGTAGTQYTCTYMKVGKTVTVCGRSDFSKSGATIDFAISVPFAGSFTSGQGGCGGYAGMGVSGLDSQVYGGPSNEVHIYITGAVTGAMACFFQFTYKCA